MLTLSSGSSSKAASSSTSAAAWCSRRIASLQFPSHGAVVARELGTAEDLPPSVAIPTSRHGAGYLGVRYAAFGTEGVPKPGKPFSVRGVALEGGLTKAAARLNVAQSALSIQLRQLEDNIGHPLFVRKNRSLVLTEAGQLTLQYLVDDI